MQFNTDFKIFQIQQVLQMRHYRLQPALYWTINLKAK